MPRKKVLIMRDDRLFDNIFETNKNSFSPETIKAIEESDNRVNQLAEENAILHAELRAKNQELETLRLEYERETAELMREKEGLES